MFRYTRLLRVPRTPLVRASVARIAVPRITRIPQIRHHSSNKEPQNTASFKVDDPQMMIAFTCKQCDTRSSHTFSKQSYEKGSVLIQCPGCKNRHLIADHLKIFRDNTFRLEDVLKASGEDIEKGVGDLAFSDIPESLKGTLGRYAKDAPEEYQQKEQEGGNELPEGETKEKKE